MPAKPLRMALESLMIQKQYGYSDRELLEQSTENPYYQYFIELPGFQNEQPFAPSLLVDFRRHLDDEVMVQIDEICYDYNYCKPRIYRRKGFPESGRCKKRTAKKIHKAIKQQLQYVRRDFGYVEALLSDVVELSPKPLTRFIVLKQVYEQQQYMYENNVHTVPDKIVSISQPYIRPIVRGKTHLLITISILA